MKPLPIKEKMKAIADYLNTHWKNVPLDLADNKSHMVIPTEPGWYLIKTNTPLQVFSKLGAPTISNSKNISNIATDIMRLNNTGLLINQHHNNEYVIYSGEQNNVRGRIQKHFYANTGGEFSFNQYRVLHQYKWSVSYWCSPNDPLYNSSEKIIRTMGEQAWRCLRGWPILCIE